MKDKIVFFIIGIIIVSLVICIVLISLNSKVTNYAVIEESENMKQELENITDVFNIVNSNEYDVEQAQNIINELENIVSEESESITKKSEGIVSDEDFNSLKVEINQEIENNGNTLKLESYAIDSENLLLIYNLKTTKKMDLSTIHIAEPDYFFNSEVKINSISNNNETDLSSITYMVKEINDFEYEIHEIYNVDSSKILNNDKFFIDFSIMELPNDAQELAYEPMSNFKFEFPIDINKIGHGYEKYDISNKEIVWQEEYKYRSKEDDLTYDDVIFEIKNLINTDILSKMIINFSGMYYTDGTEYSISVEDENKNVILEKDLEYLYGGYCDYDIILPKVNLNSKLIITIYETQYPNKITHQGSATLDLSKAN